MVEERSMRRRASRLIPLVPQGRAKSRQLVLTSKRLLCLKQRQKPNELSVKYELALKASEKLKEKDKEKESRCIIASVQQKGEREFVVLTVRILLSIGHTLFLTGTFPSDYKNV
jgi:3-phosphoinositide dependent protein kinase-1